MIKVRSTPSAVLEDTMHLVDLFLISAFAPSWIANGSILMTIAHRAAQVAGCSRGGSSARTRLELKMRDRVFLQGRVTVVAILFRSVLAAHALFHMNEDPMRVLMLNPPPPPRLPGASRHPQRHPVSVTFHSCWYSSVSGSIATVCPRSRYH